MKKQVLMMVKYKTPDDLMDIKFSDVENQVKEAGHKFYEFSENENVLLTEAHEMHEGATYIVASNGLYRSIFGDMAKRQSIFDIEGLVRNVKSDSKKAFKNKAYSVRKLTTKGKHVPVGEFKIACFNLDRGKFSEYRKNSKFFAMIAEYLKGERGDFLGEIQGGLSVEPIRFGIERGSLEGVVLDDNKVGIVRLNGGTHYTCDIVPTLTSKPTNITPLDGGHSTPNWRDYEDHGMRLFLDANRYEVKVKQNS